MPEAHRCADADSAENDSGSDECPWISAVGALPLSDLVASGTQSVCVLVGVDRALGMNDV